MILGTSALPDTELRGHSMRTSADEYREWPGAGKSIVVIGGYGAVGGATARQLGLWFPGRTVAAGRDPTKARALARSTGAAVRAEGVDVGDPADVDRLLDEAAVVVMCVERANAALAEACLRRGVHYVDVSASTSVIREIESLDKLAVRNRATAVLSVGVAPGLTNLLARHCLERLPSGNRVDISLLLGQGGDHGADSVRWIVAGLTRPDGRRPGARRARVRLPGWGTRTVHPFPFSDQQTIGESSRITATTRICFDSALVTSVLFGLAAIGFFTLVGRLRAESPLASALSRWHRGSDRFVVHVRASDAGGNAVSSTVTGRDSCQITGAVAALVARDLFTTSLPAGVLHIDALQPSRPLLEELREHLTTVDHSTQN
ncbi:saccharopine dehydrogenase family protein [Streptosporangium sp. OZ121]|uniref:saccharopine dehydrogenase family protein n=1 Tax=Streptosporangium sp. OZ121 TaxID=3444183 RepID=UPI003F7AFD71